MAEPISPVASPAGSTIVVDLADMKATNNPSARLVTNVLGSCLAMAIYDPEARVGGLLHCLLPESALDRNKALGNPYLFVDTGIPLLFRRCYKLGAVKQRIICKMAGAGNLLKDAHLFEMGALNEMAARKVLSNNHVSLANEHVGGIAAIAVSLRMEDGRVLIRKITGEEFEL